MIKSEKGQALPLAIVALALGALLVTPFLGHASSSIIGSRTYNDALASRNACDAGVEHAIWRLVYDGLGSTLTTPGDKVTYQLAETVNALTPTITITANTSGGGSGATGEIKKKIDFFDYDTVSGYVPAIVQISSTVYAIAYQGASGDGFIKTISITTNGIITKSIIDSLEFDTSDCKYVDFTHVSGNIYAVAYQGPGDDGFIKTVSIDASGNIGNSVIDTLEFDTSDGRETAILQISSNVYAIVYRGVSDDGFVKTINIDGNGIMGNSAIDTLEFDTNNGQIPDIIYVSGNIYAIAYQGASNDGFVGTINIDINGVIANSVIDTLEFDTADCKFIDIVHISGNMYAVAYQGTSDDGFVKTFTIDVNGGIGNSTIDSLEFDTADGWTPVITGISGDIYAIVYRGTGSIGIIKTITIDAAGNIGNSVIAKFTFDTVAGFEPDIIQVATNILAIAYRGASNNGYVTTIELATGTGVNTYWITAAAGSSSVQAYVSTASGVARILSWKIQ